MTEVTNGQIDPAHYGPTGDIARNIASYCQGNARAHVYTAAFAALTTAQSEAAELRKEVERLKAELERRDANENRNCINWGPCSRHDKSMADPDYYQPVSARAALKEIQHEG